MDGAREAGGWRGEGQSKQRGEGIDRKRNGRK